MGVRERKKRGEKIKMKKMKEKIIRNMKTRIKEDRKESGTGGGGGAAGRGCNSPWTAEE